MELLAPAGNLQKLKSAVLYGADAVYLAGPRFGLRGASDNFLDHELQQSVEFAHSRNCKVYVTLNAFLHESDMVSLPEYVEFLAECKVDAVIVADLGVMSVVQERSEIPIHLSTQASCLNLESAKAWKDLGVKRIILGREVSIDQAARIRKESGLEVEMFIHGAMCMAFSGNCTISNYTAGRDSNRGGCIQSCRFSYQIQPDAHDSVPQQISSFMSSKDLNGLRLLPNFVEAGIDSIKIEGRMKSTLYAATTVSVYSRGLRFLESEKPGVWEHTFSELAPELEKIPHRDYTEASLENAAEEQSIFYGNRDGRSQSGYEMAGRVLEVSGDKHFILEVQNPFQSGHELEVLEFSGSPVGVPVNKIKNLSGEELQQALPNRLVLLPFQQGIEAMNVVRRKTA